MRHYTNACSYSDGSSSMTKNCTAACYDMTSACATVGRQIGYIVYLLIHTCMWYRPLWWVGSDLRYITVRTTWALAEKLRKRHSHMTHHRLLAHDFKPSYRYIFVCLFQLLWCDWVTLDSVSNITTKGRRSIDRSSNISDNNDTRKSYGWLEQWRQHVTTLS